MKTLLLVGLSIEMLLSMPAAQAITPPQDRAPLLEARWADAPEHFEVTHFYTDWIWREEVGELGPRAFVHTEMDIHLPRNWELKSSKSGTAKLEEIRKIPKVAGQWHLKLESRADDGTADFEFVDERYRVFKLGLTLHSRNRHPYVVIKDNCPRYDVRLEQGVAHGHFLYLGVVCTEFGGEVILYFVRSPDGRWVPEPYVKRPAELAFEYKIPMAQLADRDKDDPLERHVFDLYTEDDKGRRAEFGVYVTAPSQPAKSERLPTYE